MDAGASALAFVTAGLKSAKLAYDVVSAIKEGPQKVRELESALGHLVKQLGYLEGDPFLVPEKDAAIIKKCRDDLDQVKIDVQKLCVSDKDGKLKRIWKRMKPALNEKDITHILDKVTSQTATIGVYVAVAQSTTITEIHARQSEFHKENKTTFDKQSSDIAEMSSRHITIHDTIKANTSILTDIASRQTSTQATLGQQQASLAESASRREAFENKLLRDLELLQSNTAGDSAVLEKLSALIPALATLSTSNSREDAQTHAELLSKITVLKSLVNKKGQLVPGDPTDSIKEALAGILQFLIKDLKARSHGFCDFHQAQSKDAARILRQLEGHFALDALINLNPTSMRAPSLIGEKRIRADSMSMDFNTQQAAFCITRRRFKPTPNETHEIQGHDAQRTQRLGGHHDAEIRSDLAIWSRQRQSTGGFLLKASVVEALNNLTGIRATLAPMVAVYRIVPSSSDVFQSIRERRLDKLVSLISEGKASLRDRDEQGASLLHYACSKQEPEICKFLLEHGADPDDDANIQDVEQEVYLSVEERMSTPFGMLWNDHGGNNYNHRSAVCSRYLFNSGVEFVGDLILKDSLRYAFEENLLRVILRVANLTTDISQHLIDGESLFSFACSALNRTNFAVFRLLVEAGASVNGVFSHEPPPLVLILRVLIRNKGQCFRKCLLGNDAVKTIKYLIEKGADINATWKGHSCSAIAYGRDDDTSSYIGDVWDAALAATGHDVKEFRRREQQPHSPRFWASLHTPLYRPGVTSYRLTEFRDLWEGIEDLCPYYDQVVSAGEGKVTIVGRDCGGELWCSGRKGRVEEVEDSSSEWETESEAGSDSDCASSQGEHREGRH